jgi:hypothetical protein
MTGPRDRVSHNAVGRGFRGSGPDRA